MFEKMKNQIKGKNVTLIFTEGEDPRIQEAAAKLVEENLAFPILLGNGSAIQAQAQKGGVSLDGMDFVDIATYPHFEEMVQTMADLRKGKMTEEECRALLKQPNYFGTMMVKMGYGDCLLGGATYSTADTVRPALQIIKAKPGYSIVSSVMILNRTTEKGDERYAMADCAIVVSPTTDDLVDISVQAAEAARLFDIDPKVALLSYSTLGSGSGPCVDTVANAAKKLKEMQLNFAVDGELQFDAAISPVVAKLKAPNSPVAGKANVFIFPDANAGNIGYKIAARLGGFEAFGPILLGLNAPINDLSRGSNADEIYKMGIITVATALNGETK